MCYFSWLSCILVNMIIDIICMWNFSCGFVLGFLGDLMFNKIFIRFLF